ncbi:HK97-gp10 family putative phage morphogenesis protein [Serratia nevei]
MQVLRQCLAYSALFQHRKLGFSTGEVSFLPVHTASGPHMRDSISIRSTTRGRSQVTLRVGPSKVHHMKALAQEFGTVKQVASPFIRPALDYNKTRVLRILAANVRYGIENR